MDFKASKGSHYCWYAPEHSDNMNGRKICQSPGKETRLSSFPSPPTSADASNSPSNCSDTSSALNTPSSVPTRPSASPSQAGAEAVDSVSCPLVVGDVVSVCSRTWPGATELQFSSVQRIFLIYSDIERMYTVDTSPSYASLHTTVPTLYE